MLYLIVTDGTVLEVETDPARAARAAKAHHDGHPEYHGEEVSVYQIDGHIIHHIDAVKGE